MFLVRLVFKKSVRCISKHAELFIENLCKTNKKRKNRVNCFWIVTGFIWINVLLACSLMDVCTLIFSYQSEH